MHRPMKIISGGQTGADIGALIGAQRVGIPTGGTAPRGFKTEKGPKKTLLTSFGLISHASANYKDRTKENIINSNATMIVTTTPAAGGTLLTINYCIELRKPYIVIVPQSDECLPQLKLFMEKVKPNILNIAGNRESNSPGIQSITAGLVENLFGNDT